MTEIDIAYRPPRDLFRGRLPELRALLQHAEDAGIDGVVTGDHVSFKGGTGYDGLTMATAMASLTNTLTVRTSVYLLTLRNPVVVARQVIDLALLSGGRFVLGTGLGGDDRHEMLICGVDPSTRGRRFDECLVTLRSLLRGEPTSFDGEFFSFEQATLLPAAPSVPILVGGRSSAAFRRAGRWGDGWIGLFLSPQRYAAGIAEVDLAARDAGRGAVGWKHSMYVWCAFEAVADELRHQLESLYGQPYERFAAYAPHGTPEQIAAYLRPYIAAGCTSFDLAAVGDPHAAVDAVAQVKQLLTEGLTS